MTRKVETRAWRCENIPVNTQDWNELTKLEEWLLDQAVEYGLNTLLVHADDGVIWGVVEDKKLHLSSHHFKEYGGTADLRKITLQECRLFGENAELYLWREDEDKFQARLIQDGAGSAGRTLDETQILWGTDITATANRFTLVSDGGLENRHAPPIPAAELILDSDKNFRPLRLRLRHYLDTDKQTGMATICLSRLVAVEAVAPKKQTENGG